MAQLNFGGTIENVVIRDEFPLEKAREVLKDETIAVIGYGVINLPLDVISSVGFDHDDSGCSAWVSNIAETFFGILSCYFAIEK